MQTIFKQAKSAALQLIHSANYKLQMTANDVIFASYPRVGSNWLRYILTEIICLQKNIKIQTPITPENHHDIAVILFMRKLNLGLVKLAIYPQNRRFPFKIVKTHSAYRNYYYRAIYMHRNVADTLVSYYYYHRKIEQNNKEVISINDFILENYRNFISHLEGYFNAFTSKKLIGIIVSYEKMKINPVSTIKLVCDFLELDVKDGIIEKCLRDHDYKKYSDVGNRTSIVRSGKIGDANNELTNETIELLRNETAHLYDFLVQSENGYYQDYSNF